MKKYISLFVVGIGLVAGGCKKTFDINQNPNQVTETSVTPDLALAAQLNGSASRNSGTYAVLNRWMGYWSASGSYSRSTVEMSYNIDNNFGTGVWNGIYYTVNQYKSIEKKANSLGWKFYEGISKIMQSLEMTTLVDFYNNAPYSEAWNLSAHVTPKYDNAEDIYKECFKQIDEGLTLIKGADLDKSIKTQDILFGGDKTKWAKFANTLKLRLLLHCVKTNTFNPATEIGKIVAEGSGFLGNGQGATVQPGFTADKGNPFYRAHMFAQNGNEADNYNRANNFTLDMMVGLADPRYKRLFRETKSTPNTWKGTVYGQNPSDDVNSDKTSGPGYGLVSSDAVPMWIMSSTEAMFLVAEATVIGWLSGDAKTAYRNAVRESFVTLAVPNALTEYDTYLQGMNEKVAWPDAGTPAQKLSVTIWQKYFALCGIQPNETWTDVRRLDIVAPPLSIAPERGSNPIPVRYLYPQAEYNVNGESVKAQGTISQFTSKIFWDK
ncbi:MAG TPA: SusD/RagB family nutrient-binding outer membrane lipoprotein [Phnomibacter sp.]|nr:SusD/RagB family nutrient-binding outer membrane lipoprotein [Phnomibacter sp.]